MPIKRGRSDGSRTAEKKKRAVLVPTISLPRTLPGILSLSRTDLQRPTPKTLIRIYAALADAHGKIETASTCLAERRVEAARTCLAEQSSSTSRRVPKKTTRTSPTVPQKLLHCVRCHECFDQAFNVIGACIIEHDGDSCGLLDRVFKDGDRDRSLWRYECCGQEIWSDSCDSVDEGLPFCFKGTHTMDVKQVDYKRAGCPETCKAMSCEGRGKSESSEDDEETSPRVPQKILHCIRCHEYFDQAINVVGACIIEHDYYSERLLDRVYKGSNESYWKYECCGQKIESDLCDTVDESLPFCFKGSHTTDPKQVDYNRAGCPETCKAMSCEGRDKLKTSKDDGDSKKSSHKKRGK